MKRLLFAAMLCAALAPAVVTSRAADPPVRVILWFDTEDYLLPASDDAAKRVAEILSERGIRATFKIVGEKARVLERRGRTDVIEALRKHDIGYHTNLHSVHPTPAEYLAHAGWHEGIAEFVRRERAGADDVKRIFRVPHLSTYGQPGSSWAPQATAALAQIGVTTASGVSTYVDDGSHVGLDEAPFWYAGALHVFNVGRNTTRMPLHEAGGLARGRAEFTSAYERLRTEGGGLVSIYYHPAEWVHEEFWDAVNFRRGANPPREDWKAPPQRPREVTEAAYAQFAAYLDALRALPGVSFITAADLPAIYAERFRDERPDLAAVTAVARAVSEATALDALRDPLGRWLSPADQFWLLTTFTARAVADGRAPAAVAMQPLLGPAEPPPTTTIGPLPWPAFRDTLLDVASTIQQRRQVPAHVFVGARTVAPADFLRATATVALAIATGQGTSPPLPASVTIPGGTTIATEKHVAVDTAELFGGWIIHPEGFRAPRIVQLAKLQAWTLKPAARSDEQVPAAK